VRRMCSSGHSANESRAPETDAKVEYIPAFKVINSIS
jgi:hypothetical protein